MARLSAHLRAFSCDRFEGWQEELLSAGLLAGFWVCRPTTIERPLRPAALFLGHDRQHPGERAIAGAISEVEVGVFPTDYPALTH